MRKFSEEFLNAFVDDQLAHDEKSRVYHEINQDEALSHEVCQLSKVRDLVQLAYKNPPPAPSGLTFKLPARRIGMGMAAGFALVVVGLLGWMALKPPISEAPATRTAPATLLAGATGQDISVVKVLMHLNEGLPERVEKTLNEVESLLQFYRSTNQIARIEVVANGDGIDLLRRDASVDPERVERMQKEYDNLTFVACQNTIDRLQREHGITTHLLPGVVVSDSGVAHLMRRQHQGWTYIQG